MNGKVFLKLTIASAPLKTHTNSALYIPCTHFSRITRQMAPNKALSIRGV
ncbi:hypothetical protein AVDCRST_MAG92-5294 [uncultured Coleofasciculus sp.]|uniref:Uncharacterized protein n=1 Tax=uncultured Coleofasciculus sp. TaxID=1267456 RepID=A0A6J4KDN0_9CYAN|nr:hypothetical protein AVDCRST_MAG92-5294 [uncultured Coleofasciculus sp.]